MQCPRQFASLVAMTVVVAVSLIALAGCSSSDTESISATSVGEGASAAGPEVKMVPSTKFDKTDVAVDAGKTVTITVNNTDTGIPHNFALYKSKDDANAGKDELAKTDVCTAPCVKTADVNLTPGTYFFHCDTHPSQMMGTLTAR